VALRHPSAPEKVDGVLALGEVEPISGPLHRDAEEEVQVAEVRHGELRVESISEALKECWCRGSQHDVVDVQQQVGDTVSIFVDKERRVRCRGEKVKVAEVGGEALVPSARCLLQAIEGLAKKAHVIRSRGIDETCRLLTVNCLIKSTMKKSVLDVELMNRPGAGGGDAEHSPNSRRFDNRTERLIVVDAVAL
jgi:hypothetical protein